MFWLCLYVNEKKSINECWRVVQFLGKVVVIVGLVWIVIVAMDEKKKKFSTKKKVEDNIKE